MESRRQVGASSSTTDDIFGAKKSSTSSFSAFDSIFPPPQVVGRKNGSDIVGCRLKPPLVNQAWSSSKQGNVPNKDDGSLYRGESGQPCHLSSSLYYGGQDVYSNLPNTQNPVSGSGSYPIFKKDGEEDDLNGTGASRGNWWQGSLYY